MVAAFVFAIATYGKIGRLRQHRQQIAHHGGVTVVHFRLERTLEAIPVGSTGCLFAFGHQFRAMKQAGVEYPRLAALHQRVKARPRIARHLASARRLPFNKQGIFRHYKELDAEPFRRQEWQRT